MRRRDGMRTKIKDARRPEVAILLARRDNQGQGDQRGKRN